MSSAGRAELRQNRKSSVGQTTKKDYRRNTLSEQIKDHSKERASLFRKMSLEKTPSEQMKDYSKAHNPLQEDDFWGEGFLRKMGTIS